jgi:hypothetical protein
MGRATSMGASPTVQGKPWRRELARRDAKHREQRSGHGRKKAWAVAVWEKKTGRKRMWRLGKIEGWEWKIAKCKRRGILFIEES